MITPAKKQNLYEEVVRQIIEMISNNQWKPGERIIGELELSKQFQVSRNSIRESIKALELVGVLESRTGIGTFVTDQALLNINSMLLSNLIDEEGTLVELMETRLIIEPGLTYLAVKYSTEEDLLELENIIRKGKLALIEKKYTFDMGFEFHKKIFAMSRNRILINLLDSITSSLIITRSTVFFRHLNEYIVNSELDEHIEIMECIRRRDAVLAKNLMQRHLEKSLNLIKESNKLESDV